MLREAMAPPVVASGAVCGRCAGSGMVGLLGRTGLGLVSKACPDCKRAARSEERDALWELRECHCNLAYKPGDPVTEKMLLEIWNAAFPEEPLEVVARSEQWKRLGFQSADPRTDVRAGRFALDQLHYLAVMYPGRLQKMAREALELEYFLAISCFNVTHVVLVFFDLVQAVTVSPVPGAVPASRAQRKNFLRMCSSSPFSVVTVLNELFVALVERLHLTWRDIKASEDSCNVMQHFQKAMHTIYDEQAAFWKEQRAGVEDFRLLARASQAFQ